MNNSSVINHFYNNEAILRKEAKQGLVEPLHLTKFELANNNLQQVMMRIKRMMRMTRMMRMERMVRMIRIMRIMRMRMRTAPSDEV